MNELTSPEEVAGFIISNFPSIGFLSVSKRFTAFQWMTTLLDHYREQGGDYISAFDFVVGNYKPAKKSFIAAYALKERLSVCDLNKAGFVILKLYG